jgi:hypothetical protein
MTCNLFKSWINRLLFSVNTTAYIVIMPDIRTGIVTSVGKMAKTITVTTRTMNPVPKLLVVCLSYLRWGRTNRSTNESVSPTYE